MTATEWRPATTACNRFEVSNDGRVRNRVNQRELSLHIHKSGYAMFCTRKGRKGRAHAYKVHRLVALAFHGTPPTAQHEVNHLDGVKTNNHASNLTWVTSAENSRHARDLGLIQPRRGTEQPHAKLTDERVRMIRRSYQPAHPIYGCRALAARFGVSHSTVSEVINHKIWTHVPDSPAGSASLRSQEKASPQ